jgi:shikimate 5-dehydrogenase
MTVADLTTLPHRSPLLRDAEARGCAVVCPLRLFISQLALQCRLITGQDVPRPVFEQALAVENVA